MQWRMFSDGSILFCFLSDLSFCDKFVPKQTATSKSNNVIREETILGGYYLQPRKKGTLIQYISEVEKDCDIVLCCFLQIINHLFL